MAEITTVLGIPFVAMVLIIAVAGTVIYHLRNLPLVADKHQSIRQIVDSRIVIFGTAVGGAFVTLPELLEKVTSVEAELGIVIGEILAIAGLTWAGAKVIGKKQERSVNKVIQQLQEEDVYYREPEIKKVKVSKDQKSKMVAPPLFPKGEWYQTNLKKSKVGLPHLDFGQSYLWIKIEGINSFLNVLFFDARDNLIQIDQSHEHDEDNNVETTRIELFTKSGKPFPRGKYSFQLKGDAGTSFDMGVKRTHFLIK